MARIQQKRSGSRVRPVRISVKDTHQTLKDAFERKGIKSTRWGSTLNHPEKKQPPTGPA